MKKSELRYIIKEEIASILRMEETYPPKIKNILNRIGNIEEKIYDQYSDDEVDNIFDYSKDIDNIKEKYKNDENKMYDALVLHLKKLKKLFPLD